MDSKCIICIHFHKKRRTPPPPPLRKEKILPHHVYRRLELWKQKLHTVLGGKSTGNRQKWAKNAPFASVFSKIFSGRPRIPSPYYERINSPLWLYMILYSSRITYVEDRSFEGNFLLREKNQHDLGKKWAQNAPFASIFQKFPGGGPGPPPAGGGNPL